MLKTMKKRRNKDAESQGSTLEIRGVTE